MKENNSKTEIKENKKPDIKIFVSHRIDMEAETIDNPLYVNVRCGAVFDKRENVDMLGDNTGDNISEKRESFNELTVMYWAWKNVEADYYGLCHYRRYFSFSKEKPKEVNMFGLYKENYFIQPTIDKYGLNNDELIINELQDCDCIFMDPIDVSMISTPKGIAKTLKEKWMNFDIILKNKFITLMLLYIKENYYEIYISAEKFLKSKYHIGYNVHIMKKEIFKNYCKFKFDVLFYLQPLIEEDNEYYSMPMRRSIGFLGEILTGIYYYYLIDKHYRVKTLPLIYFEHIDKQKKLMPITKECISVVSIVDDYTIEYFAILLQSIIDNIKNEYVYDIIILEKAIHKDKKNIISHITTKYQNVSIRYIDPEYFIGNNGIVMEKSKDYYKFIIPWLLPNYDKVLIIDCDTILLGDIAEIYNQDISDYLAGACKDIMHLGMYNINENGYVDYVKEELKLHKPYEYFNTKIMLLNTDKIRNSFNIKDIFNKVKTNKYNELEQDLFNNLLNGKVKYFDYKYSIISEVDTFINSRIEYAPKKENNAYRKAQTNPFVINFNNYPKPWSDPNIPYSYKWWEIARKTPFYEMILYRMIHEQSSHISSATIDHFSRIMFPFKLLKKVHKVGYIRQIADRLLPHGTKRRKIVKKLIYG